MNVTISPSCYFYFLFLLILTQIFIKFFIFQTVFPSIIGGGMYVPWRVRYDRDHWCHVCDVIKRSFPRSCWWPFPLLRGKSVCVCVCSFLPALWNLSVRLLIDLFFSSFPPYLIPLISLPLYSLLSSSLSSQLFQVKLVDVPEMGYLHSDRIHGNNIPCDGRGEVCVRGSGVISGYYKDEEETEAAGLKGANGWLKSGDIGTFYFTLLGPTYLSFTLFILQLILCETDDSFYFTFVTQLLLSLLMIFLSFIQ